MQTFRPIQYLGNKSRVLKEICSAVDVLLPSRGHIADLFTGSTIVAQALSERGHRLAAVDSQSFCNSIATTFLSIGRKTNELCIDYESVNTIAAEIINVRFSKWLKYEALETSLLSTSDTKKLRALYRELPLIWRDKDNQHYQVVGSQYSGYLPNSIPLLTSIYAGSYFGIAQALRLDGFRQAIRDLHNSGSVSSWQTNAALTCLMSAASAVVHSAGKHFAQPLSTAKTTGKEFKDHRLLKDRRISLEESFSQCAREINKLSFGTSTMHSAYTDVAERFISSTPERFDLYYIDPPYTAQQYSRYYHLLETICTYRAPNLFEHGRITSGLYPANRFKSAFCSKKRALPAFQHIVATAKHQNSRLLISYSHSESGSNGNARIISLREILSTCREYYRSQCVEVCTLGHRYRQFNNIINANQSRNDPEVLIACRID